ncbi:hypothetical protein QZH41_006466 [Actinostola sp. cb2023]|nr:hypothetical protein QZH41_006466 [Actinostola sp. cb2023]
MGTGPSLTTDNNNGALFKISKNLVKKGVNPCGAKKGVCSHICLLAPRPKAHTCHCPDGIKLLHDGKTCKNHRMSYIHKPHLQPLEHGTPFQLLRTRAKAHPNKEAFVFRDTTKHRVPITFQEYDSKSQSFAAGLLQIGLTRGDRVLLMVPSCPEFVFLHMALNRIGAIVIVDEEVEDLHPVIESIKDLACVISKTDYHVPLGQRVLNKIRSKLDQNEHFKAVLIGSEVDLLQHNRVYSYDDLFKMAEKNPESHALLQKAEDKVLMDDPFIVMFTSGSTAAPKPIEYSNHAFVNGGIKDGSSMNMTEYSILFNDSPFDWMPGMGIGISTVITLGSTLVAFPPKVGFKGGFTSTIMETMAEEACTHCFVLPYFLVDLVLRDIRGLGSK